MHRQQEEHGKVIMHAQKYWCYYVFQSDFNRKSLQLLLLKVGYVLAARLNLLLGYVSIRGGPEIKSTQDKIMII